MINKQFTRLVSFLFLLATTSSFASTITITGNITTINDTNNVLAVLGWSSVEVGQSFTASYTLGASPAIYYSVLGDNGMAYGIGDPSATASVEVFGSGSGELTTDGFFPHHAVIGVNNDHLNGADYYSMIRYLSGPDEVLLLNVFLGDSTGTQLSDESFFVMDSKEGWDIEGFAVMRVLEDHSTEILLAGTNSIPVPGAAWLFGSSLLALVGFGRRNRLVS